MNSCKSSQKSRVQLPKVYKEKIPEKLFVLNNKDEKDVRKHRFSFKASLSLKPIKKETQTQHKNRERSRKITGLPDHRVRHNLLQKKKKIIIDSFIEKSVSGKELENDKKKLGKVDARIKDIESGALDGEEFKLTLLRRKANILKKRVNEGEDCVAFY